MPRAIAAPWFEALANPRFLPLRCDSGCHRSRDSACGVSSLEALSMTITSCGTSRVWAAIARRHLAVYSRLLKTGMMIEISGAGISLRAQ